MPGGPAQPGSTGVARSTRIAVCSLLLTLSGITLAGAVVGGRSERSEAPAIASKKIDMNNASAGELELLPRIGPALAARIQEDRDTNGPYAEFDDLQRVSGIGPKTAEALEAAAVIGRPSQAPASADADE